MVECTIVAKQVEAEAVLEALQEAGIVHMSPIELPALEEEGLSRGASPAPDAKDVRTIYGRLQKRLDALNSVAPAPARLQIRDMTYLDVGKAVDELIERRAELRRELENLDTHRDLLVPWGNFDPKDLAALEHASVRVVFMELTEQEWARFDRSLPHATASVRGGSRRVVVFDPPEAVEGTVVSVPRMSLEAVVERMERARAEIAEAQRELGRFHHFAKLIEQRLHALRDRMEVLDALDGAVSSGPLFAVEGFFPRDQVVDVQQALAAFPCVTQVKDAVPLDERVPVKLQNGALLSGFESVVEAFSGIRYGEKDFTWAVGLLFVVFGSLCLLDAGYGLMLAILGVVLRSRGAKAMGNVFALTGLVSMVVGMMAGQFFGLIIGQTVMLDSRPLLTLSSEPYHAFLFSLFVGIIALGFSYSMAIWQRGIATEATGALMLVLATLCAVHANMATEFVLTFVTGATPSAQELALHQFWGNCLAGGFMAAALWGWIASPGQVFGENARVGNVLWTIYSGATGFVQDVLSHMRLFGIALSGGIMALVVNQIGARLPLPAMALFAVFGHFFVFLLSLLSLYIHTNRLIFLEWGSKCIDGGSNFYAPLRRSSV